MIQTKAAGGVFLYAARFFSGFYLQFVRGAARLQMPAAGDKGEIFL